MPALVHRQHRLLYNSLESLQAAATRVAQLREKAPYLILQLLKHAHLEFHPGRVSRNELGRWRLE